jgi:voltage-gated potassium channel
MSTSQLPGADAGTQSRTTRIIVWMADSLLRIAGLYLTTLLLAAWLFSAAEDRNFGDGLYWSYVTALSIGYGDISPATFAGRTIAFVFGHVWIYIIGGLIIANILERVRRDKHQYSHAEQEWTQDSLKRLAAHLHVDLAPAPSDTEHGNVD